MYVAVDLMDGPTLFTSNVNARCSINGLACGSFVTDSAPVGDRTTYAYNKTLFNVLGLKKAQHTLRVDLVKPSLLLVWHRPVGANPGQDCSLYLISSII